MSALLGIVVGCGLSFTLLLMLRPLARRIELVDSPSERKTHQGEVPLIGGVSVFLAVLLGGAWLGLPPLPVVVALGAITALGVVDDLVDIPAWIKLGVQIGLALLLFLTGEVSVTSLGSFPNGREFLLGGFGLAFTVLALTGLINAVNMIDGVDGLASGLTLSAIANAVLLVVTITGAGHENASFALLLGALLGFLLLNLDIVPGRKVFLGDAGSMLLGLYLGYALITLSQPNHGAAPLPSSIVPWLVAIPVLDTLRLIGKRLLERRSPFTPGRDHIHHLLLNLGFSPRQTLVILLLAATGLVWFGYALFTISSFLAGIVFIAVIFCYPAFASWLDKRTSE